MTSSYLTTLYQDFANKVRSVTKYNELLKNGTGEINQATYAWVGKLKEKYDILDKFQQSRQKSVPATEFSVEFSPSAIPSADNTDIKKADSEINDLSEKINYLFTKAEKELGFLTQSYEDLQNLVNKVWDQYQDLFDKM